MGKSGKSPATNMTGQTLAQNKGRAQICDVWIFQNSLFCDSIIYRIAKVWRFPETEEIWWDGSRKIKKSFMHLFSKWESSVASGNPSNSNNRAGLLPGE